MFVFVRLIDSHGHQYPNKKTISNDPKKNQKQNPEKPPIKIGRSKIQRKTESVKTNIPCVKQSVPN
jgi:hypothetical protein